MIEPSVTAIEGSFVFIPKRLSWFAIGLCPDLSPDVMRLKMNQIKNSDCSILWHAHSTWSIRIGKLHLLIDPFLDDNPAAKTKASTLNPSHILISHGHFDHIADAASIANRSKATVLANYEIATWLTKHHSIQNTVGMNHGGTFRSHQDGLKLSVQLVPAVHSSSLPDGSYGGTAGGWVIDWHSDKSTGRIYYAGDTALFSDMQWVARTHVDLFIVPIGDLFTMGVDDSIEATRFIQPSFVMPTHYGTWPPIAQDAQAWAKQIEAKTDAKPVVPEIDKPWSLPISK
jgi:L-ascorbate metabolism protein UlaG (beta-lactamase superfamily)